LPEYVIGTGGWGYFKIPGLNPLEAYSRLFNFVEVNSTFYRIPDLKVVESWRQRVPQNFEFSLRLNRAVTHRYELEPHEQSYEIFEYTIQMCRKLGSELIVIETPAEIKYDKSKIKSIKDLFESLDLRRIRIAWEVRGESERPPNMLINLMAEQNVIHCVDLSKSEPAYESDQLYTRLFGKGEHNLYQFSDADLLDIDKKTKSKRYEKVTVSFHNVRMYKDAARYKMHKETGEFPPITRYTGLQSLKAVLREDAKFPVTKEGLIKQQGWKVIDITKEKRVHAEELLQKLQEKTYQSVDEVLLGLNGIHA